MRNLISVDKKSLKLYARKQIVWIDNYKSIRNVYVYGILFYILLNGKYRQVDKDGRVFQYYS